MIDRVPRQEAIQAYQHYVESFEQETYDCLTYLQAIGWLMRCIDSDEENANFAALTRKCKHTMTAVCYESDAIRVSYCVQCFLITVTGAHYGNKPYQQPLDGASVTYLAGRYNLNIKALIRNSLLAEVTRRFKEMGDRCHIVYKGHLEMCIEEATK